MTMKKSTYIRLEQEAHNGSLKTKADAGNADAAFDWAWCLEKGIGTEENLQEALKYYLSAAELGDLHALGNAAAIMLNEDGENDKAINMMQKAARLYQKAERLKPKECTGADLTALCSIP